MREYGARISGGCREDVGRMIGRVERGCERIGRGWVVRVRDSSRHRERVATRSEDLLEDVGRERGWGEGGVRVGDFLSD